MRRLRGGLVALVAAVVVLTGCDSTAGHGGPAGAPAGTAPSGPSCLSSPAPTAAAPAPTAAAPASATGAPTAAAPASAAGTSSGAAGSTAGQSLDLTLPCFVGGQPVRLAHLGTPAVINLWASWCRPCITELPHVERFADRSAGRVQVIGVITQDPVRSKAQSVIDEFGLSFPMLYDKQGKLQARLGPPVATPTTLLVDAQGRVAYRYSGPPLDEAALADLVRNHLGVAA